MRTSRTSTRVVGFIAGAVCLLVSPATAGIGSASPASRAGRASLGAQGGVSLDSSYAAAKSPTSRLAQSDPALLKLTGSKITPVLVKLDYDSLATYQGDASGRGATSPSVTGKKLNVKSAAAASYNAKIDTIDKTFRSALAKAVPSAKVGRSIRAVYGGVSVRLPAGQIAKLVSLPGVVAVQPDVLNKTLALPDESAFIGAQKIYTALGSNKTAGAGTLIADLDTGIWPEHPSFAARGDLGPAPTRPDGSALTCELGDNPLTPANDPFVCNNKLVGGASFLDTYDAVGPGDELYKGTGRDDDGHGTHTASTAGGNPLNHAVLFGVDRGPVQGIAPGAWVAMYRVCGPGGCFSSDTTAAAEQAVLDGADAINFSISGGSSPYTDATELAFLDAYAAGVFVSASAGNSGPAASTTDHLSPWVMTIAASTQSRAFVSTVTLTAGAASVSADGSSIMGGIATPTPVVRAENLPGYEKLCLTDAPAAAAGKIVICTRGTIGRVLKGLHVANGGGAGMILENPAVQDTETDNHFLPAVHLDQPAALVIDAFLAAHPAATATFTNGVRKYGFGDVMAGFSSRGPRGDFLKPDITSTGVQVLAGNTPTPGPDAVAGTLFQAIAGTSMSAPHITGSGALLKALHPDWNPGQIKSALETTANQKVVKEDGVTPADVFDFGGGREDLTKAGDPGLTFDETPARMATLGFSPTKRVDLNLPSVYAPQLAGRLTTVRTAKNVTSGPATYRINTSSTGRSSITVTPSTFTLAPGASITLKIVIDALKSPADEFQTGEIDLIEVGGKHDLHLPVAFNRSQGAVKLATSCPDSTVAVGSSETCTVTASNDALVDADVDLTTTISKNLTLTSASAPATIVAPQIAKASGHLAAHQPAAPGIADGSSPFGYNDLADFGIGRTAIGDEAILNFNTPQFTYHGEPYTQVGVTSNGYIVVGGGTGGDVTFNPQTMPDTASPNNVLAPYWSDLDGAGTDGIRIGVLSAGPGASWLVVQVKENLFGTSIPANFQIWLGINGVEDISYTYDPDHRPVDVPEIPNKIGAENTDGTAGATFPGIPAGDLVVSSTPGAPGGVLTYSLTMSADFVRPDGFHSTVRSKMSTPLVRGVTTAQDGFLVTGGA